LGFAGSVTGPRIAFKAPWLAPEVHRRPPFLAFRAPKRAVAFHDNVLTVRDGV